MQNINKLSETLAFKALKAAGNRTSEIDRYCWMVTHEYCNGVMPVEYDIKGIDEDLYLEVLKVAKSKL